MTECSIVASNCNRPIVIVRRQAATHTALSDWGPSFKIFCRILQEVDSDILVHHIPGDCNLSIWTTRRNQAGALLTGILDVTGSIFGRTSNILTDVFRGWSQPPYVYGRAVTTCKLLQFIDLHYPVFRCSVFWIPFVLLTALNAGYCVCPYCTGACCTPLGPKHNILTNTEFSVDQIRTSRGSPGMNSVRTTLMDSNPTLGSKL